MILIAEDISYTVRDKNFFGHKDCHILKNISFSVERGAIYGITGESGSGKTTLAKIIAGIFNPSSGKVNLNFISSNQQKTSKVQLLFQNNGEIINPFRKGYDILRETIKKRYGRLRNDRLEKVIKLAGISEDILSRRALELSGGEQQRIALARVLAAEPELLILDEPFSAQDPESQLNLLKIFNDINKQEEVTIICISHSTALLKILCSRIMVMFDGKTVEEGESPGIFINPATDYARFLFASNGYNLSPGELRERKINKY